LLVSHTLPTPGLCVVLCRVAKDYIATAEKTPENGPFKLLMPSKEVFWLWKMLVWNVKQFLC